MPGPGRFFGHEVTIRHSIADCVSEGVESAGRVAEPAIKPSAARRVVSLSLVNLVSPKIVKMMDRTRALANI